MKAILKISFYQGYWILLCLLMTTSLKAQNTNDPTSYLKFIDSHNGKIVAQTWNYMEAYTTSDDKIAIKGKRKKLENVLKISLRKIRITDVYDQKLQEAAITYLEGNLSIVKNELLNLLDSNNERTVSVDQIALIQKIRKAIVQLRKNYNVAVRDYGTRYSLQLVENDSMLAKQMEHTIKLYDYYHNIQIEFSKLQIAESNLWNGLNEKSLSTLKSDVIKVKESLLNENDFERLGVFKNDPSLIEVLELMNTHLAEAVEVRLAPVIILKEDQAIGNRDKIMIKTKNYNTTIKWANHDRKKIYDQWNESYPQFLRSHINSI